MGRKVGMVHAGCFNVRLFNELASEVMPGVEIVHLVDEGLPVMSDKRFREKVIRRLRWLAFSAEESGAEAVLLTCTAFGRLADEVKEAVSVPVLSVLEIITDEATGTSDRIGILGTHPGTVASASQMIQEQAKHDGRQVEVKTSFCPGAFDALKREDLITHDRIVLEHLNRLMEEAKAIVVPQPSIDRVIKQVPEAGRKVPIMPSALLSMQRLKATLDGPA